MGKHDTKISCNETISEYIDKSDWRINANSNTGYSHAGMINNAAGKVIANFWLDKIYSKEIGDAHRDGSYHIHDLDNLSGYCAGWNLRTLLNEGFNGVRGRVEAKAPKHFKEALGQMVNHLCFSGDTHVLMDDGSFKSFKEMAESEQKTFIIKSYDWERNKFFSSVLTNVELKQKDVEVMELEFEDGDKIKCTPDHKFYTSNRGWVEAKDLTEEDDIVTYKGEEK